MKPMMISISFIYQTHGCQGSGFSDITGQKPDVKLRMAEVLALAHDLQRRVRDNVLYQTDALFEKYNSSRRDDYFKEKLADIKDTAAMKQ